MNPEMSARLTSLLDYVADRAKSAEGFVMEQAPLIAQEIVAWEFWHATLVAVSLSAVLLVLCLFIWSASRGASSPEFKETDKADMQFCVGVAIVISAFVIPAIAVYTNSAIKAVVAPRLVILDYIRTIK